MALIFMDGFDANDLSTKWFIEPAGGTSSSSTTRFGSGLSLGVQFVNGLEVIRTTGGLAQMFLGFAIYWGPSGFPIVYIQGDNGNTTNLLIEPSSSGLFLKNGASTTLASYLTSILYYNSWYYLEIMVTLASSGGQCQIRVNGTTVINFSGNTLQGGTATTIDRIGFGSSSNAVSLIDDLYLCDATGGTNNTFLGDVRVQTILPTAAGSSTQLTPTGNANNWQNVDDVPDSTANYNSSSTVGQRDTYLMGQLLASTGTVFGTQDNIHAFKQNSGAGNLKAALKSGATVFYDTTQVLDPTNTWFGAIRQTDPNTSAAWTVGGVNSIEFGAEVA